MFLRDWDVDEIPLRDLGADGIPVKDWSIGLIFLKDWNVLPKCLGVVCEGWRWGRGEIEGVG